MSNPQTRNPQPPSSVPAGGPLAELRAATAAAYYEQPGPPFRVPPPPVPDIIVLYAEVVESHYRAYHIAAGTGWKLKIRLGDIDQLRKEAERILQRITEAEREQGPRCPECAGPMTEYPWGINNPLADGPYPWTCPRCYTADDPFVRKPNIPAARFPACPVCGDILKPGGGTARIWWSCPTDGRH